MRSEWIRSARGEPLRAQRLEHVDQLIGFLRQRAPRRLASRIGVELLRASDLFERARGRDHAVGIEVRRGALQAVRRAAQRLAVPQVERLADAIEMPRRIVDEEAADLGEQLAVAADARE